jgi:hypothetical protein
MEKSLMVGLAVSRIPGHFGAARTRKKRLADLAALGLEHKAAEVTIFNKLPIVVVDLDGSKGRS